MKRINWIGMCLIIMLIPMLQACMDETESGLNGSYLAISTVRLKDAAEPTSFYLVLDNGKTVNPVEGSAVENYKAEEGQRTFTYMRYLEKNNSESDSYDYNAEVFHLQNILTKDIIPLTQATADSIGADPINMTYGWVSEGYLTLEFQFYSTNNEAKRHMINMVYDVDKELVDAEGYINLEFRHNAFEDESIILGEGLASFKLDNIAEELENAKGIKIEVNTIYNGSKQYILNLENHTHENTRKTTEKIGLTIF